MAQCDNKSVGVIIRRGDDFAVIKRKNFPVAYAFVAGHLDGDAYEDAAKKEAREEAGIQVQTLGLKLHRELQNPCKREGGGYHIWKVFEAVRWSGELYAASDAKEARWVTLDELKLLAERTKIIANKLGISVEDLQDITPRIVEDTEWQKEPGLEPVWVVMLEDIGIL